MAPIPSLILPTELEETIGPMLAWPFDLNRKWSLDRRSEILLHLELTNLLG
mgnify:CR=1 FL=1